MASAQKQEATSSRSYGDRRETIISLEEDPMDRLEYKVRAMKDQIRASALTSHSNKSLLKPRDIALLELKHLQGLEVKEDSMCS